MHQALLISLVLVGLALHGVSAVQFTVNPDSHKCIQEDVHKDVLVVGDYEISDDAASKVTLEVS